MENDDNEISFVQQSNIHSQRIIRTKFECLSLQGIIWFEYKNLILEQWNNIPNFLVQILDDEVMVFKLIRMNYTKYGIDYRYILKPYNIAHCLNYEILEKIYNRLPLIKKYVHGLSGISAFYNNVRYDTTIIEDVITQATYNNNCSVLEFMYDNHPKEFRDFINMWCTYRNLNNYTNKNTILFIDNLISNK